MIPESRIRYLNRKPVKNGRYVLYWMQASQRTIYNHALEYAIRRADEAGKPVLVFFGLTDSFPDAGERHYRFMLEGLQEVHRALARKKIRLVIQHRQPDEGVVDLSGEACLVVVDRGYLKIQRDWRKRAAEKIDCPLIQVESDVVVPVEAVSEKEEFSAGTLRPKLYRVIDEFLLPLKEGKPLQSSLGMAFPSIPSDDIPGYLPKLKIQGSSDPVRSFTGGETQAAVRLVELIEKKLERYGAERNDPNAAATSNLSPYLHFGQISPLKIVLDVMNAGYPLDHAFLEELIVRRELSMNFVYYNEKYHSFEGLPDWAKRTLEAHRNDLRENVYSEEEFRSAATHDPYWNAAQKEMITTGKMHGYMRMYWGKKILEWTRDPESAFEIAIRMNNEYELDGRDANGFAGVAWCFGKHDRAWFERPVYGKVRYMNSNGLKRKFDADRYVRSMEKL